jgi:folate-binding protein YgfZ
VQGPKSPQVVTDCGLGLTPPAGEFRSVTNNDPELGEICAVNLPRVGTCGFDIFVPINSLGAVFKKLLAAAARVGGQACGWQALEIARIEAGIPRFGVDMDETNLAPEAGIEKRAISYTKGCYTGQEVIARIRTYGQVAKSLRKLRLADDLPQLPAKGDKLAMNGKEVGYVTSSAHSPSSKTKVALGYVRRECNQAGTELALRSSFGESKATIAGSA